MSKIEQIQPGSAPAPPAAGKSERSTGDDSFQKMLEQAAGGAAEPSAVRAAQPYDPLAGIQGVKPPLTTQELSSQQTEGLMHAERTLELLTRYEQMLGDERKSLKDVSRVVQDMDGEVKGLAQALDKLDPSDHLYGLLQEVAVTAMVQSIKFNRGDFIPAGSRA